MRPILIRTAIVLAFVFSAATQTATEARAQSGVVSGELVQIDGTRSQFRIVGHGGTFTAPSGVSLESLDGKPVRVDIVNGRVAQITYVPIATEPIEHGFETVTGELVVRDAASGSFTIAGDGRLFTVPPGVDVQSYAGRRVEVRLNEHGRPVDLLAASASGVVAPAPALCSYDGRGYSEGASVCQSGTRYRCATGKWLDEGACASAGASCLALGTSYADGTTRCADGTRFRCDEGRWRSLGERCAADNAAEARATRTCELGGATVAHGSSICRDGVTYRCTYGQWVHVGTPCS